jgi:hypothetical protein
LAAKTAQSVHFPHQAAFGRTAEGGVTGQYTDGFQFLSDKKRGRPHFGSGPGGLQPGVTAAHYQDITGLTVTISLPGHSVSRLSSIFAKKRLPSFTL